MFLHVYMVPVPLCGTGASPHMLLKTPGPQAPAFGRDTIGGEGAGGAGGRTPSAY